MQFIMDMEELVEGTRKVITQDHLKGSRKGHKKVKKTSQIEFDRKLIELEVRISALA